MQKITHENKVVGYVHNETLVLNEEDHLVIGCQKITRSQIERLAGQEGWDFPTA